MSTRSCYTSVRFDVTEEYAGFTMVMVRPANVNALSIICYSVQSEPNDCHTSWTVCTTETTESERSAKPAALRKLIMGQSLE